MISVIVVDFLTCSSEELCVNAQVGNASNTPSTVFLLIQTSHFVVNLVLMCYSFGSENALWLAILDSAVYCIKKDVSWCSALLANVSCTLKGIESGIRGMKKVKKTYMNKMLNCFFKKQNTVKCSLASNSFGTVSPALFNHLLSL